MTSVCNRFDLKAFTLICCLVQCTYSQYSEAQPITDTSYFGPVLKEYYGIAGNFGEMRSGHFHSGIDYKTNETEGLPVFAAADGYISRIKVSSVGYGNALYINHPNGTTTVYGHLKGFSEPIQNKIRSLQYDSQEFEQQIFPGKAEFTVNKGDLIGWSGNSGGSYGPHLHFEVRNTASEKPFDPILAGFNYHDTIPPVINKIAIYDPGTYGALFEAERKIISLDASGLVVLTDTVFSGPEFFIGVNCHDLAGDALNNLGVDKIQMYKNDSLVFEYLIQDFEFSVTRYVNACIDFPYKSDSSETFIISNKLKGNVLDFYPLGSGLFLLDNNETARIKISVFDAYRNKSEVKFIASARQQKNTVETSASGNVIIPEKQYNFSTDHYNLSLPSGTFYEAVDIDINTHSPTNNSVARVISIQPDNLAVQNKIELSLNIVGLPDSLKSKAVICKINNDGKLTSYGGETKNNTITTKIRTLGTFSVFTDTIPPVAENPVIVTDEINKEKKLIINIHDNLSGIKSYKCSVNDIWVLSEFNALRGELTLDRSWLLDNPGQHTLLVELSDLRGNTSKTSFDINY